MAHTTKQEPGEILTPSSQARQGNSRSNEAGKQEGQKHRKSAMSFACAPVFRLFPFVNLVLFVVWLFELSLVCRLSPGCSVHHSLVCVPRFSCCSSVRSVSPCETAVPFREFSAFRSLAVPAVFLCSCPSCFPAWYYGCFISVSRPENPVNPVKNNLRLFGRHGGRPSSSPFVPFA